MEDDLKWKTTSNGRRPPMEDDLQWKTTSNGRRPQMEDDLQWRTTTVWIMTYEFLGGNFRETQRKSRVWLCSAQFVLLFRIRSKQSLNTNMAQ